jgi:hypothetical protein
MVLVIFHPLMVPMGPSGRTQIALLPSKRNFFKRIQRVPTKDSFYLSRDKQEYLLGSDRITGLGVHLDPKASSAHDRVHAAEIVRG